MEQQLQQALAEILSMSLSAAQAGVGFLQEELPEVIRQLLVWKAVSSGISFACSLFFLCVFVISLKLYRKGKKIEEGVNRFRYEATLARDSCGLFHEGVGAVVLIQVVIISLSAWTFSIDWVQILIAPKVYLIEYAASLAK